MNGTPEEIQEARSEFSAFEGSNDFWTCLIAYTTSQRMLQEYIEDPASLDTWRTRARNLQKSHSRVFIKKLLVLGELPFSEQIEALTVQVGSSEAFISAVREDANLQRELDCFLARINKELTWQRYVKALDELVQKRKTESVQ